MNSDPVSDDDLNAGFQTEAADKDAEAIMQQIRARLRARRAEAKDKRLDLEAYADGLFPMPPGKADPHQRADVSDSGCVGA